MMHIGDGAATHLRPLAEAALRGTGPILELGSGWYSTAVLSAICTVQKRMLATIESDVRWAKTLEVFTNDYCKIQTIDPEDWLCEAINISEQLKPGLVFIDVWPGSVRKDIIGALKNMVPLIVAHDTELRNDKPCYQMENILAAFSWRKNWEFDGVGTTCVSNSISLTDW